MKTPNSATLIPQLFFEEILWKKSALTLYSHPELSDPEYRDDLTEVYNRRYFTYYLESKWNNFIKNNSHLALMFCDLARFQIYNNHQEHLVGDQCLKQVAKAIQNCIKKPLDTVVRYAEDEFAVILPDTFATDAMQIAEGIRGAIYNLNMTYSPSKLSSRQLTVSWGGCSLIPTNNGDLQTLIFTADKALDQAKTGGRNQMRWIDLTHLSSIPKFGSKR